jgi:4-amino-4-deoxy-L-arabinose transferase-like glycosyltransferase
VFLILILAFLLRLPLLNGSFWLDEAAQALESIRPLGAQLQIIDDFQPPLFHIIVHFFSWVSHQEWWLRLPSLIAGVGTVALLYQLLLERFGKKTAVIGSLLLATSPFHVFYSQELRPYALAALLATLSWYFMFKKQRTGFIITTVMGLYTMYLFPFNLLAQLVYVFSEDKKFFRSLCLYSLIASLFFLPWLPTFVAQLRAGTTLTLTLPGWSSAVATPQLKALPLTVAKFLVGPVTFHGNRVFLIVTGVLLVLTVWACIPSLGDKKNRFAWYWIGVPLLGAWLLSFFIPIIQPKRVLFVLPAFLVLISLKVSKALLICVFVLQLFCLARYYSDPSIQREDWRSLVQTIESQETIGAVVLFSFPESFAPWRWYTQELVPAIATGRLTITDTSEISSVSSQLDSVSMVYLFDYLRDLTDPQSHVDTVLVDQGFRPTGLIDGKQVGFVRIFKRQ